MFEAVVEYICKAWFCGILINYMIATARLAQSVERWTFNPTVKGSSPLSGDLFFPWSKQCLIKCIFAFLPNITICLKINNLTQNCKLFASNLTILEDSGLFPWTGKEKVNRMVQLD